MNWTNEKRQLRELVPWEKNPRQINKDQARRLRQSLGEFGQVLPICIDPNNTIIDGHQRNSVWSLADEYGPKYTVDVRVASRELSDKEQQKLTIFLEKAKGDWNFDTMAKFFEVDDLLDWGFDEAELDLDMWGVEEPPVDPGAEVSRADELREKWQTELGQLWQLDEHRLICGDCTDAEVVERLMGGEKASLIVTDPPYGVSYDGGANNEKKREVIVGDDDVDLYDRFLKVAPYNDKCALYMWHAGQRATAVYIAAEQNGFTVRSQIIWHKLKAHYGAWMAQYKQKHEPCLYCVKNAPEFSGRTNEVTVWEYDQPSRNEFHPTEKPIELMDRCIGNHPYDLVYDPFLGSGTTMIAAERLGRRCFGIDIDPKYVAVALERWAEMTGIQPVLLE